MRIADVLILAGWIAGSASAQTSLQTQQKLTPKPLATPDPRETRGLQQQMDEKSARLQDARERLEQRKIEEGVAESKDKADKRMDAANVGLITGAIGGAAQISAGLGSGGSGISAGAPGQVQAVKPAKPLASPKTPVTPAPQPATKSSNQ